MNHVEQAGARSRRETSDIGSADGSFLDPVDVVRGLAHMDVLRERVTHHRADRLRDFPPLALTAASRHIREHGHELAFACCAPYAQRAREAAA